MFGFNRPEDGSAKRFRERALGWLTVKKWFPLARHHAWWVFHNCVAHPIIGIVPWKPFFKLHDWTSHRMNPANVLDEKTEERNYFAAKIDRLVVENGKRYMDLMALRAKYEALEKERAQLPSVDLWVRYLAENVQMKRELMSKKE